VILTSLVSEFRLQKKVRARDHAAAVEGFKRVSHSGFEVVAPLVGGVDCPEPGADGEFGQARCPLFLPRRAVEELGDQNLPYGQFIVVKSIPVPQSLQLFPCFKILDGVSPRTREIAIGDGVGHPLQIDIDSILSFLYAAE
jgi:hypothetical protein